MLEKLFYALALTAVTIAMWYTQIAEICAVGVIVGLLAFWCWGFFFADVDAYIRRYKTSKRISMLEEYDSAD